jgi:drug/metabolite transporter (DMT)-like permease
VTNDGTPSTRAEAGRATVLVALSAAGFAAIAIFVIFATRTGAPLLTVVSGRYVVAGVVLMGIALATGAIRGITADALKVMVVGGIGQSAIAIVTLIALNFIPAATLSFLFYTYPGWVALIARVRHSEALTPVRMFALVLSLSGIFVMVGAPGAATLHPAGVVLALTGALLYAIYVPAMNQLQQSLPAIATAAWMSVGSAIIVVTIALVRGELVFHLHPTAWYSILGLALISTVAAFFAFLSGLRVLGPLRTAIVSTVEPFFTSVLGAWALSQPMTRTTLLGGALIAGAVILLQLPTANNAGRS